MKNVRSNRRARARSKKTIAHRSAKRRREAPEDESSKSAELDQAAFAFADACREGHRTGDARPTVQAADNLHNAANRYVLADIGPEAECVMDGFERVLASPAYPGNKEIAGYYVVSVLDIQDPERFDDWEPWHLRPLLASWLRYAPEREVSTALKRVRRELKWIEQFEVEAVEEERKHQRWLSLSSSQRRSALGGQTADLKSALDALNATGGRK